MDNRKGSFVRGAAVLAIAGLIVKLIGAIYRIPLANIIETDGLKFYEVAYPWYSWLLVISSAGLPTAISKLVSERVTLGDYRGARDIFRGAMRILIIIGTVTMLIMLLGAELFAGITYPSYAQEMIQKQSMVFRVLSPALLFVSIMCAYRGYLQGMQLMMGTAVSQVVEQVGKLIIGFTLAARLFPKGPEYAAMGALLGVSASELIALIVIWLFYKRNKGRFNAKLSSSLRTKPMRFRHIAKKLLVIAIPITIGASIMPLTGIMDSAMITRGLAGIGFTIDEASSAYAILRGNVTPIINMPAALTTALAISLVPAISARMATKNYKGVRSASKMGMKLALIIGAPCAAGLYVLAEPIIRLLFTALEGQEIILAADLMKSCAVGVLFLSLVQTMTGVLQGMGRPNIPVINLVFGGILKVITMLILMRIPTINIQGAAISTIICYAAAGILDTIYVLRKTGMRVKFWDMFLKPISAAVVMAVSVSLCYNALNAAGHNTLATVGSVAVGVVVYAALMFLLKMFSPEELEFMPGGHKLRRLMYRNER